MFDISGAEGTGTRSRENSMYAIMKDSELGQAVENYQNLDYGQQKRLLGYMETIREMKKQS